jgi:hypothetical protein
MRGRVYPGENQSFPLVRWLNDARARKGTGHITSLIEALKELKKVRSDLPAASINPYEWRRLVGTETQFENLTRSSKVVRKIDGMLSRYKVHQRRLDARSWWKPSWIRTPNKYRIKMSIVANGDYAEFMFGEADAVNSALRLAEEGYLIRLRECHCGRWFYARFDHQMFCSTPCQRQHYRNSESFLATRREYMRGYRMKLAKQSGIPFKPRPRKQQNAIRK